ncbi:hypothetical protein Agub_g1322 [Astrephomene gubernaculifera]|uniref:ATP-dependent RNA helicase n=1 Tax=Astrephomene gubernaculifera TaxID=47775 RepID=A0AAD3HHM8_9CHLO|nr:hypothetical protein Agub_g1322 [Astrephomene gubernaculifera]
MDDELELNISIPAPSQPRKAAAPARKDGGAKQNGDSGKAPAKPQPRPQANAKTNNGKVAPAQQNGGVKPADRRQQHAKQNAGAPAKQPQQAKPASRGPTQATPKGRRDRPKQQPGKERFKRAAGGRSMDPDDPDELLRADDDDEADDVAAVMGLMAQREAVLREEEQQAAGRGGKGKMRAPAAELEGVVDFGDDDDEGGGGRKRRRLNAPGGGGPGGSNANSGGIKASGRGNFTPGSLIHAAPAAATAAATADGAAADGSKKAKSKTGAEGAATDADGTDGGSTAAWTSLGLAPSLSQQLQTLGFAAPTPIQRAVVPVLLSGRDALVRAQTGSGKTLSYLLPVIHDLQAQQPRISRGEGTYAILLAPTRELCLQVHDVASGLLRRYHWLVAGLLMGGENRAHEKARLRKGVSVLAASPGRLLDHLQSTAAFRTSELRWLVLDEADRLLDLGFEAKLRQITELLNSRAAAGGGQGGGGEEQDGEEEGAEEEVEQADKKAKGKGKGRKGQTGSNSASAPPPTTSPSERRRTVLVSATLHRQLGALAELALRDPAVVGFERQGGGGELLPSTTTLAAATANAAAAGGPAEDPLSSFSLPASLRQTWLEVPAKERLVALAALLRNRTARRRVGGTKVVVFLSSCVGVEFHHHLLGELWSGAAGAPLLPAGCRLLKLHGDMPQAQRTETFAGFAKEGDGVLLCTDVAARGLDFPNVSTIIQYDVPGAPAEYVHRVGRSARMGAAGEAVLLLMPHEVPYVSLLRSRGVMLEQEHLDKLARWLPTPPPEAAGEGGMKRRLKGGASDSGGACAARQLAQHFHRHLSVAVSRDPHAAKLATDAFRSYVRAYATHSGDVKRWFAVRNLHLGHVAHAFCLRETPTAMGSSGAVADRKRRKREAVAAQEQERYKKMKRAAKRIAG